MRSATAGPTRGRRASLAASAVLMLTTRLPSAAVAATGRVVARRPRKRMLLRKRRLLDIGRLLSIELVGSRLRGEDSRGAFSAPGGLVSLALVFRGPFRSPLHPLSVVDGSP